MIAEADHGVVAVVGRVEQGLRLAGLRIILEEPPAGLLLLLIDENPIQLARVSARFALTTRSNLRPFNWTGGRGPVYLDIFRAQAGNDPE